MGLNKQTEQHIACSDGLVQCRSAGHTAREHRRHKRLLTLQTAKVLTREQTIHCAVLNISAGGACLLVPNDCTLPTIFDLIFDHVERLFACKLVWTDGPTAGVQFSQPLPSPPECWTIENPDAEGGIDGL